MITYGFNSFLQSLLYVSKTYLLGVCFFNTFRRNSLYPDSFYIRIKPDFTLVSGSIIAYSILHVLHINW